MLVIEQSHEIITQINRNEILKSIELAGRTAYKSEDKITSGSASKFVTGIIKRRHESVIEHVSLTIRFITDRGVTHELVRHRMASPTQESTRYCNYAGKEMQFIKPVFWNDSEDDIKYGKYGTWLVVMESCEAHYNTLIGNGATPQEARSVLPNSLKTEIVVTANLREWRHILKLRTDKSAHPQMRALMIPLLNDFKNLLPEIFDDIVVE